MALLLATTSKLSLDGNYLLNVGLAKASREIKCLEQKLNRNQNRNQNSH
jgi:hypothetical protein